MPRLKAIHAQPRTVVQIFRRPDGQRIQAKAVIEGIPSLGLPTTAGSCTGLKRGSRMPTRIYNWC
jgi:hypothetical protein